MSSSKPAMAASDFVHLHNHTHHSVLDGLQKVEPMVQKAKQLGMQAIAMTDHGTMSGAVEFYKAATAAGVKPIIGMETYVAVRRHLDKDPQIDKKRYHLTLLAMNNAGYMNLMKLSTIANLEGFYHKPRIDFELLKKYNEGLIVLSGCIGGEVSDALRNDDYTTAKKIANQYKKVLGDRYYIELQDHSHTWDIQKKINEQLLTLAKELSIEAVVTTDAHYLNAEDKDAHEVLLCVQTGSYLSDEDRMSLKEFDLHMIDPKEIIERWKDVPEVVKNSKRIADRCDVSIELDRILIPKFDVPKGLTEAEQLQIMTWQGLAKRYAGKTSAQADKLSIKKAKDLLSNKIRERAEFELKTIADMGFSGYFLIVSDFVNWGKNQGIVFGPGRGSVAGSIVAYAIRITDIDPLKYDLLFERFLNPERISMPDIDIDIQDNRRDEVIAYCIEKYSQDRVAHIVTFGTMAARNAIRDVARVLEVPYADADRIAKMVPPPVQGRHIPLEKSIVETAELRDEYESSEQSRRVIDLAMALEGTIRSHGVHAAGVVIAPDELVLHTPLEMAQKGVITTQYPMYPIEELGLLKMDFLGLKNLTIIKNALRIIKKVFAEDIDITAIPLDDRSTYDLLSRGDSTGVFQFESGGMKRYLKLLKPEVFEDIIAMGALYRPGPLTAGLTDRFIARKNGDEPVEYEHKLMEQTLKSTYGVLVYQEQVMRIAREMCGFSGGQADTLRKAIGKKNLQLMAKMKKEFIEGMITNSSVKKSFAEKLWKDLEGFADYAFNKSHSACYGLISYQTAYLKANYPTAFMAALMTSDYNDIDRLAIEIAECQHMGIEVVLPDINESFLEFAIVPDSNKIRFGMAAIKNVGTAAVEEIIRVRDQDGKFTSVEDFARRVSTRTVNRKTWESLIKAGAFDSLQSRQYLLDNLDVILAYGQKVQKEVASGQVNLFGSGDIEPVRLQLPARSLETNDKEALQWERELLGIYLSKHPLDGMETYLADKAVPISQLKTSMDGKVTTIGGVISSVKEITTRNGAKMAFVSVEDKTAELEVIVFPNNYSENTELWQQDNIVLVSGKISTKDRAGKASEEIKVLADTAEIISKQQVVGHDPTGKQKKPPAEAASKKVPTEKSRQSEKSLYIHIKQPQDNQRLLALKRVLNRYPGSMAAVLVLGDRKKSAIRLPFGIDPSDTLKREIADIYSTDCVVLK